jgi:hypothetical protein
MRTRLTNIAIAAACAVALSLMAAATTSGKIVVQKGIAGARIGMTKAKVVDKLGKPDRRRITENPFSGEDFLELKYGKTWVSFGGTTSDSTVFNVSTKDPDERTSRGVGVGSSKRKVREEVPGVTCRKEFGINHCWVGDFEPFETVTDFRLRRIDGVLRVTRVGVGIVLD